MRTPSLHLPNPLRRRNGDADSATTAAFAPPRDTDAIVDLKRRSDLLTARVAELHWDLGGLVHEMAIRNRIRVDVIVRQAATLQSADAELTHLRLH